MFFCSKRRWLFTILQCCSVNHASCGVTQDPDGSLMCWFICEPKDGGKCRKFNSLTNRTLGDRRGEKRDEVQSPQVRQRGLEDFALFFFRNHVYFSVSFTS